MSLFLAATVLAQGLLGLGEHRSVAIGWVVGLAGLVGGTLVGDDAVIRATAGLLGVAGAASLAFALLLRRALHRWTPAPAPQTTPLGAVVEAATPGK